MTQLEEGILNAQKERMASWPTLSKIITVISSNAFTAKPYHYKEGAGFVKGYIVKINVRGNSHGRVAVLGQTYPVRLATEKRVFHVQFIRAKASKLGIVHDLFIKEARNGG